MKALRYISIISVVSTVFFSCTEKEPDIPTPKLTFSDQVEADFESIAISCAVSGNVSADRLTIEYSKDQTLASAQKATFEKSGDSFKITITGLEIQTTYYYRYTVENKASVFSDEKIRQFKTLDYVVPEVTTIGAKDISGTTATLEGKVDYSCGKTILEQGFRIGKDKNTDLEVKITELNQFTLKVEGLEFETTYYYQAYAKSEIGTGYGEMKELKTCNAVSFKPIEAKSITASSVVLSGGVDDNGGITIDKQGFRYSEVSSEEFAFIESTGEATLNNLKAATAYRVWFYAKTFEGEFSSEKIEFVTTDGSVSFGDYTTSDISAASISISTSVNGDGGSPISLRGFVYGTSTLPTIEGSFITVAGTVGQMTATIPNLTNNTVYHIRAFAQNDIGVSYGTVISITTKSGLAELSKTTVSDIKAQSASLSGSILTDNGASVLTSGFCYGMNNNLSVSDNKVTVPAQNGQINASLTLEKNTKYYVRAFATTSYGTTYGEESAFTTKDGIILLTNLNISNIYPESATAAVTISDDGGCSVIERGFCFATSEMPTVTDKMVTVTSSETNYSGTLSSLCRSTKYFVRGYAKNSLGTYYSGQESFTTFSGVASLGELVSSNIENTSAAFSCEVTSNGGASITGRGFCYSNSPMPTVNSSKQVVSGTVGSMQSTITNLEPGTSYYVRAFVTTNYETTYSNEVQITTKLGLPTMSPVTVTNIQPTSVTLSSGISKDGDGYILEKGFCYGTTHMPDKNSIIEYVNNNWLVSVSSLKQNTTYYVRSFATTQYGTAYSDEFSFSTTYNPVTFGEINVTDVGIGSIAVCCPVSSYGGNSVIEEGFCISRSTEPTTDNLKVCELKNGEKAIIYSLDRGAEYYIRRYVINEIGTFYSAQTIAKTVSAPEDAIPGIFSISESKKIAFSKGNVLRNTSGGYYFSETQYLISPTNDDLLKKEEVRSCLTAFNDIWCIISSDYWRYLLQQRENASALLVYDIIVEGVHGALLLPDNWPLSDVPATQQSFSNNTIQQLETRGAVFIPYSGALYDSGRVGVNEYARLRNTISYMIDPGGWVSISTNNVSYTDNLANDSGGASVRLVYHIKD